MQVSFAAWFYFPAGQCACSVLTRQICLNTGLPPTAVNLLAFGKDEWPPNSPDVNPLDYLVWEVRLEHYKTFHPKPQNTDGLKEV